MEAHGTEVCGNWSTCHLPPLWCTRWQKRKKKRGELLVLSYRTTVTVKDRVQARMQKVQICIYAMFKESLSWVKRNSRHKAGFMCACLDRVLMLGSIPCCLVIANTCAHSISQQPAEGVLAPGLLGRRLKATASLHQESLWIHSRRGHAQRRGRTRSVQIPTSCFQSRAPGTRS